MKNKKDFVSFFENPHLFLSKDQNSYGKNHVIKNNHAEAQKSIKQLHWDRVMDEAPKVIIVEKEGQIEAIKFKCPCGCSTTVKIEYDTPSKESVLN